MIKIPIHKIIFWITLLGILLGNASSVSAAAVSWLSYSDSIFTDAKQQNKLILVYIKSDTCHWCARMNSEVLNSPSIVSIISKKYIPVVVDITYEKSLADEYGAYGTPTFIILDSDRHEVSRLQGYEPASDFKVFIGG